MTGAGHSDRGHLPGCFSTSTVQASTADVLPDAEARPRFPPPLRYRTRGKFGFQVASGESPFWRFADDRILIFVLVLLYSCNPTVGWRARRPWGTSFSKIYLLSFLIYPTVSEIECRKVTRRSSWIRKTLNERVQVQSSELTLRLVCCESSFDTSWRERFKEADFRSAWPDSRLQYPISR